MMEISKCEQNRCNYKDYNRSTYTCYKKFNSQTLCPTLFPWILIPNDNCNTSINIANRYGNTECKEST